MVHLKGRNITISLRLKELRLQRGISLQEVADNVGVSKSYLWGLEKGRNANPTLEFLQRVATYYGITVAEIVEPNRRDIEQSAYFWSLFNVVEKMDDRDRKLLLKIAKTMHQASADKK